MLKKIRDNWPLILGIVAVIVWLVRLEARVLAPDLDQAVTAAKLEDLKERVGRIETKVDELLRRNR